MNYTFLPQEERKKLKREYRVRALVVLLFVFSAAVLVGIASLFPAFIDSKQIEGEQLAKIAEMNKINNQNGLDIIKSSLKKDSGLLAIADKIEEYPEIYPMIKDIISAKGNVSITSISMTDISSTTADFIVQGTSPTREELVSFKNRLESSLPGSSAELPISDLAKNKDIDFSLKLTYSI